MRILLDTFGGKYPKTSPRAIPQNLAQIARNVLLESGQLKALPAPLLELEVAIPNPKSIYLYERLYPFTFATDVDVVPGAIAGDAYHKAYFTGQDYPRVTRNDIAVGTPPMPIASFRLGIPAPPTPTLISLTGTATGDAFDTAYVQTFITSWGEEGPPSSPSVIMPMAPGQTITLNLGSGPASGNYNLGTYAQRRIYRLNSASGTAEYQQASADGEILYAVQTFADSRLNAQLGYVLPTDAAQFRIGPPDDNAGLYPDGPMIGLCAMPGGGMAGFSGKTICFCEPYLPQWWPLSYRLNVHENIVGIKAVGDGLVVCTNERPYLCLGSHPASMTLIKLELRQACVSKRSIVDVGGTVIYASPDGLVGVNTNGAALLTENIFTRAQWQAYLPSTIDAFYYEGLYIGFYGTSTKAGFIFDPRGGANSFVDIDEHADAGYNDMLNDALYVAKGAVVSRWQAGALKTYTWKSKQFVTPAMNFAWVQVSAESYPVTFKLYADGVLVFTKSITSGKEQRLPGGRLAELWEIELSGTATVNHVLITDRQEELF